MNPKGVGRDHSDPAEPEPSKGWRAIVAIVTTFMMLGAVRPSHCEDPARITTSSEESVHATTRGGSTPDRDVMVGFGGVYKTGCWTPLRVTGARGQAPWLWVDDPDGVPVGTASDWRSSLQADATPSPNRDSASTVSGFVRFGRPRGAVGISSDDSGSDIRAVDLPAPLPGDTPLLAVMGKLPAIARACRLLERPDGVRPLPVQIEPAALHGSPLHLDAADALVLCGTSLGAEDGAGQVSAVKVIDTWVRRGGHMLLLAGQSAVALEALGPPFSQWLPGQTRAESPGDSSGLAPLRRTVAVELFSRTSRPLAFAPTAPPRVPVFRNIDSSFDGSILLHEGQLPTDLPLVTRRAHGLGTITWVGLDLDAPPFVDWAGSESFLSRLLADRFPASVQAEPGTLRHAAGDLAGQLRRAVDTFPGITPVPFGVVAALAIGHVAMLYPLSWWLASRLNSPTGPWSEVASWLFLPAMVVLFTSGSIALGSLWLGKKPSGTDCGIVDIDVAGGQVRVTSYAGAWSPENDTCAVSPEASDAVVDVTSRRMGSVGVSATVSWFADAGRSLGGADAPTAHPSLASHRYHHADGPARLVDVPIAAASSRLFESRIDFDEDAAGEPAVIFEGRLDRHPQGTLRGQLVSRLPFPLKGCRLAYAGWVYSIGTLSSGDTFDPSRSRGPTSLGASITRWTSSGDKDLPVRFDRDSRDSWRILEVAGFFSAAGGESYTGLPAGRLARLDMSPLIEVNRAVLTGEGPAVADWSIDTPSITLDDTREDATRRGMWRFVVPLGRHLGTPPDDPSDSARGTTDP